MSTPTETVFFVDRCLGKRQVAEILRNVGAKVEIHDDHFRQDAQDTQWLPEVSHQGWIILTKDESIGRRELEKVAVFNSDARVFVLVSKDLTGQQMGEAFAQALEAMKRFVERYSAPFIAKVYRSGEIKAWKDHTNLT